MSNKRVLLTGGLGFIGSHTAVVLIERGYEVVIVDNLSNTTEEPLDGIEQITGVRPAYEKTDLSKHDEIAAFFEKYSHFDGVIHFAAFKAVGESYQNPLKYYNNNLSSLSLLLQHCLERKIPKMIFSSSCTVETFRLIDALRVDKFPILNTNSIIKILFIFSYSVQWSLSVFL